MQRSIPEYLFLLAISFVLSSCADLTGANTGADEVPPGRKTDIKGIDAFQLGENRYRLSGTMDNGGDSSHHFEIKAILNDSQSLRFYFFSNENLEGGVEIEIKRQVEKVIMTLALNGKGHSVDLSAFGQGTPIHLDIDVHNDHTDTHILVWRQGGPHEDGDGCTFNGGCLYNSEDFAVRVWLDVGTAKGNHWGFQGSPDRIKLLKGPNRAISDA